MITPQLYQIALACIPKVGAVMARQLIAYCGGVEAVFNSSKKALQQIPGIGPQLAENISNGIPLKKAESQLKLMSQYQIKSVSLFDEAYPERLKHIPDGPVILFYQGNIDFNHHRNIAVVGTRKPSAQGLANCDQLIERLASYDIQLFSGLAYGIDIAAHRKSLQCQIPTVGVLAHGLQQIYPAIHRQTAQEMLSKGGLVTEYPFGVQAEKEFFPMRNRIVAGLCDAIIVIETAKRGGSMITAELANGYDRDVFAFPGRPSDPMSVGCNWLIKNHKAALIDQADDLIAALRWEDIDQRRVTQQQLFTDLEPEELQVANLLKEHQELGIDQISGTTGIAAGPLASLLLSLEFKGILKALPGKRYLLKGS